jgi:hypothetical protein
MATPSAGKGVALQEGRFAAINKKKYIKKQSLKTSLA